MRQALAGRRRRPRRCSRRPAALRCRASSRAGPTASRIVAASARACREVASGSATANRSPAIRLTRASRAGGALDQVADALDHLVAGAQAERLVDRRELVDVDVEQRRRGAVERALRAPLEDRRGSASPSARRTRCRESRRPCGRRTRGCGRRAARSLRPRSRETAPTARARRRSDRAAGTKGSCTAPPSPARLTTIGRLLSRAHASRCFCVRSSSCADCGDSSVAARELEILVRHDQRAGHAAELVRAVANELLQRARFLAIVLVDATGAARARRFDRRPACCARDPELALEAVEHRAQHADDHRRRAARAPPPPSSMTSEPSGRASAPRSAEMKTGTPSLVVSTLPRLASVSLARCCSSNARRSGRSKPSEHQTSSASGS